MADKKNAIRRVPVKRLPPMRAGGYSSGEGVKYRGKERIEECEDDNAYCPEKALWKAVILQAMQDVSSASRKRVEEVGKMNAKAWLFRRSRDFDDVCEMAGFDPDYMREHLQRLLEEGHPLRYIRCKRKVTKVDRIRRISVERSPRRPSGNRICLPGVKLDSPLL